MKPRPALPSEFLESVATVFPPDFSSTEPSDLATYGRDWIEAFPPRPSLLCRPRTTDEASRLMRLCSTHRVPVVPSGGRTGLACGALAMRGELVLSLERMSQMEPVDLLGRTVRVQAGTRIEALGHHCAKTGLFWPIELETDGAQVGGIIATNAGGMRVIRYGLTRHWVLGLTVVLANGDVIELNGALEKNNTGVDLRQLFIGSEGILGVVTEATLKLAPARGRCEIVLLALPSLEAVQHVFERAREAPFTLTAYEFFTDKCLARFMRHRNVEPPFSQPSSHYVLLELEVKDNDGAIDAWLTTLHGSGRVTASRVAQDAEEAQKLWDYREGIMSALVATGSPRMSNIGLPVARLQTFCVELDALLAGGYPDWELCLFGHIGDGNLHVNVLGPDAMEKRAFLTKGHAFEAALYDLVRAYQGSVSAEHGIGLLKKAWLDRSRSATEIELMRALKRTLDPLGILNPGKVL